MKTILCSTHIHFIIKQMGIFLVCLGWQKLLPLHISLTDSANNMNDHFTFGFIYPVSYIQIWKHWKTFSSTFSSLHFAYFLSLLDVWCKYEQLRSADTSVWENTVKSPCNSPQLCAHAPTQQTPPEWDHTSAYISSWHEEGSTGAGKLREAPANISRY